MKRPGIAAAVVLSLCGGASAAELAAIKLDPPDKTRGLPFMQNLSVKASATD